MKTRRTELPGMPVPIRNRGATQLNNLIWVWNSPLPQCYPGDDVVDIISRDMYPPAHLHTSRSEMYYDLLKITETPKVVLIGETGTLPSVDAIVEEGVGWVSFMTWSKMFCLSEENTTFEMLRKIYSSPNAVTKDTLPVLY